jgi:hypothetical protein
MFGENVDITGDIEYLYYRRYEISKGRALSVCFRKPICQERKRKVV